MRIALYRILALPLVAIALSGCSSRGEASLDARGCASGGGPAEIDWADFVRVDGVTYEADSVYGARLKESDIGDEFARTRCKLSDVVADPNYVSRDGDAAYLEPGTPLFEIEQYDPSFRVAVEREGEWTIYEAEFVEEADVGRDLLDIDGRVTYIGMNSVNDGRKELASIRDEDEVARLVEMVLEAPVDPHRHPGDDDRQRFVAFHLDDGTATARAFYPESNLLFRGILVPDAFTEAIEAALADRD